MTHPRGVYANLPGHVLLAHRLEENALPDPEHFPYTKDAAKNPIRDVCQLARWDLRPFGSCADRCTTPLIPVIPAVGCHIVNHAPLLRLFDRAQGR